MERLPVLLGSLLLLLMARADPPGGGDPSSPAGGTVVGPEELAAQALLLSQLSRPEELSQLSRPEKLSQLSRPEKLSQLDAVTRHQRQIRFKSSYRELPAGLRSTFLDGGRQDLEGLSYFIQVDVDDPPASTALTKLPKGARTYFPPQLSEPLETSLLQEEDPDDDATTEQLFLVGSSSSYLQALSQEAAKAHEKALLGSKTDISPHLEDLTRNGVSLTAVDDNALVTSPSTSTLLTYSHAEASLSMTENPFTIQKGILESSSYTSYSPDDSQTSRSPSATQDYTPSPATTSSSSLRSSPSSSPRIPYASPSPVKSISSYSLTPSSKPAPSSSAPQSFSSYSTAPSVAVKSPPVSPASNSLSSYSFITSSPTVLPRKPSASHSFSSYSFTTASSVSSTSKSLTNPSPVTSDSSSFGTSAGSLAPAVSSTSKTFAASPPVPGSEIHSSQSLTASSSSSSTSKSDTNYFFTSPPPSISFSSVFKNPSPSRPGKDSQTHLTKHPLPLTSHSGTSSLSKTPPIVPLTQRFQKSFFQATRPPNASAALPRRSSSTRNRVSFETKHLQILSPPERSEKSPASAKPLTNSHTLTRHRSRPTHTPSSSNVVTQSKPELRAKSLSSRPTNRFQAITSSRRGGQGRGKSGGRRASVSKTRGSDGKTVDSSDDPYAGSIPGRSGVDYPTLLTIPKTGFDCSSKPSGGYFADVETNCQVFHVCWSGRSAAFLCPVGTVFSQQLLVCDWWYNVDCSATETYVHANAGVWQPTTHLNRL